MGNIQWKKLLIAVGVSLAAGLIGSIFTSEAIPTWYAGLTKPDFNPPNWLFAPVWTTLYILMGISLYLVWVAEGGKRLKRAAIWFFFFQLILNTLWSILFFGFKNPLLAFIEILMLWLSIGMTILLFQRFSRVAAQLLLPYLLWVTFATVLNGAIMLLN